MKKMFVVAMTAAAMISAASAVTASACQGCESAREYDPDANVNVRVTVRLTKEQMNGDAFWDQTVNVHDINMDGYMTSTDAVISAFYAYNPTSEEIPLGTDCVWGHTGRYQIEVTDGSGKQVYDSNVNEAPYCELTDGMWLHIDPYILDYTVYLLDWSGLTEDDTPMCPGNTTVDLRTVKYPAGDFRPVPAPFTEIMIDDQPTGMMTDANGRATITLDQAPGSHKMTANFPTADEKASLGEYYYWIENPEWVQNEMTLAWQTAAFADELKAGAEGAVAAETTAAITAPAETSAPAAATAAAATTTAKQTAAAGTTKAGSLKTGDSAPVAALVIAGLAAAGTAIVCSRKRRGE